MGQRDGRSKNTGAPVGFAVGGGEENKGSCCLHSQRLPPRHRRHKSLLQRREDMQILCLPPSSVGANLQVGYLPRHLQWWDVDSKGVFLAPKRAQSRAKTLQAAHYQLRATSDTGRPTSGRRPGGQTSCKDRRRTSCGSMNEEEIAPFACLLVLIRI